MTMGLYDDEYDELPARPRRGNWEDDEADLVYRAPPHSGLGIASCIIFACALLLGIVVFVAAGLLEMSRPGSFDDDSPEVMLVGLALLADMTFALVGLVLGIVGAATGNCNKLSAGLGIGLNGLLPFALILLMVIGAIPS